MQKMLREHSEQSDKRLNLIVETSRTASQLHARFLKALEEKSAIAKDNECGG